jgi:hypothetical protein
LLIAISVCDAKSALLLASFITLHTLYASMNAICTAPVRRPISTRVPTALHSLLATSRAKRLRFNVAILEQDDSLRVSA